METTDGTRVAEGPKSDAAIAAAGSDVLRQEQGFDAAFEAA